MLTALPFLLPVEASADPSLFLNIVEELESLDLEALKDLKLAARLKADKNGKMLFQCLNFSMPVADDPFYGMGKRFNFNQIEVKAVKKGVAARIAFSF